MKMKGINELLEKQEIVQESAIDSFITKLFKFFTGLQNGMSAFQIRRFVLSAEEFPTPASKYWQCKREIFARMQSIVFSLLALKRLDIDLEDNLKSKDFRKREVDAVEIKFKKFLTSKKIEEAIRETNVFLGILQEVEKELPDKFKIDKELSEPDAWKLRTMWKSAKIDWLKGMPLDYLQTLKEEKGEAKSGSHN
jgi:hypothetical protein